MYTNGDGAGVAVVTKKRSQSPASLYFQKRAQERVTQPSPYYDSLKNAQAESTTAASKAEESTTSHSKPPSAPAVKSNAPGIFTRAVSGFDAATNSGSGASNDIAYKKRATLFDDIFNVSFKTFSVNDKRSHNKYRDVVCRYCYEKSDSTAKLKSSIERERERTLRVDAENLLS